MNAIIVVALLFGSWLVWNATAVTLESTPRNSNGPLLVLGIALNLLLLLVQAALFAGPPTGTNGHANIAGAQVAISSALLVQFATTIGPRLLLAGWGFSLAATLLTGSRTALVAVLVIGAATFGLHWLNNRNRIRFAFISLVAGIFLAWCLLMLFGSSGWDRSRLTIFEAAISAWFNSPVTGWGFGAVPVAIAEHTRFFMTTLATHAHNFALQVMVEFGLLGIAALAIGVRALLKTTFSSPKMLALTSSLVVLASFDHTFINFNVLPLIVMALAILASTDRPEKPRTRDVDLEIAPTTQQD